MEEGKRSNNSKKKKSSKCKDWRVQVAGVREREKHGDGTDRATENKMPYDHSFLEFQSLNAVRLAWSQVPRAIHWGGVPTSYPSLAVSLQPLPPLAALWAEGKGRDPNRSMYIEFKKKKLNLSLNLGSWTTGIPVTHAILCWLLMRN